MAVAGTTRFMIGAEARCSDGVCAEVRHVVADPVAAAVTHLVPGPEHPRGLGRLAAAGLIDAPAVARLRCTLAGFARLSLARKTHFLKENDACPGYAPGQVLAWPCYGAGGRPVPFCLGNPPQTTTYDSVPLGGVEIARRGDQVHASDGDTGRAQGPAIDPRHHHVTHVLLQEDHLRGREEVAVPIRAVGGTGDGIQLTKQEVGDLPPVDVDDPDTDTGGRGEHG